MSADFVIEDWPTSGGSSAISGELEWPEPSHYRTVSGEIPYSHPGSEILTASVSGHYLDINNKLYEKSNYVGLRGVFKFISIILANIWIIITCWWNVLGLQGKTSSV